MSTQSAKKKRLGSRRMVPNQNETSKADNFHVSDSNSVAHQVPEESTESLNVPSNPDDSKPEAQQPPSPEFTSNRRKLGSRRKNKGRQHVKDSEPNLEPEEEVEEKTGGNKTLETTQTSLAIPFERQEETSQGSERDMSAVSKSSLLSATTPDFYSEVQNPTTTNCPDDVMEILIPKIGNVQVDRAYKSDTKLEGIEEIKESAHAGISELASLSVLSCPSVDQQPIKNQPSNSGDIPDEELSNVYSVEEIKSNKRDDDTDLFREDGNLQDNCMTSESHVESEVVEFITPEITTDKSSPRENNEIECRVEQAIFSSPKEKLHTNEEHFNIEVRGAQHSEDGVNKAHKEDIWPIEIQAMLKKDYSPENVILDGTENADTCAGNLIDQAEITNTYQSELMVKSTDDSAATKEVSNPDDKQDEHHTKERNLETLGQKNDNNHVYDSKQPWINSTERVDTAPGQMYEGEGQVEDDIIHITAQIVHQDKERVLSEVEKSNFSLQTLPSEINAPLDSQSQDSTVTANEQTDTGFNPSGNRRKLGSSRRNKGRQRVKESKDEVSENTSGDESPEMIQMSSTTETRQEELSQGSEHDAILSVSHDSSTFLTSTPGYSSEVQNPSATNYPETDLESLILKSATLREDRDERDFKVEMSDKSTEATLEGLDKSDPVQSEEFGGAHHSEDVLKKAPEEEVTDDSATKQEVSNPDDKQDEHHGKENNFEALDQIKEDYHLYGTKKPQISDVGRVDTALGQVEFKVEDDIKTNADQTFNQKEQLFPEMEENKSLQTFQSETNAPFHSQPLDNSVSTDEKSNMGFQHSGNRRKLGSSRRNKGKQCVKDSVTESNHKPTEEADGNTGGNEHSETTTIPLTTETAGQEKSMETMLERMDKFDISELTTISVHSNPKVDQQVIDQSHCIQIPDEELSNMYCVTDAESKERDNCTELLRQDGNLLENYLVSEPHVYPVTMEISTERSSPGEHTVPERSVEKAIDSTAKDELPTKEEQLPGVMGAQHSEDAVKKVHEQEIQPAQMQEMFQIGYMSESVVDDATETNEISSGNLIGRIKIRDTYQSEPTVESTEDPTPENNFEALDQINEVYHVYDTKKPQISDRERIDAALDDVYETEGQVKDDTKSSAEKVGHREKEGLFSEMEDSESPQSLQCEMHVTLDSQPQQNDTSFNPGGNRRKLGSGQEKSMETMLEGMDKSDAPQIEHISVHAKPNAHSGTLAGISEFTRPTVDRERIKSNSSEMPDEGLPTVYSVTENKGRGEDTDLLQQDGNLQGKNFFSDVKSENIDSSITTEISTDKSSPRKHTEVECSVAQETFSSPKEELATNGEQNEPFNSSEVRGTQQSEDVVNKVHEEQIDPAQMQEMHQIDYTSVTGCKSSVQTLPSETDAPLDSQPQDSSQSINVETHTGFNPAGNRRKLGSSRRNKGRQHVKDFVVEAYHELEQDVVANTWGDETTNTTKLSLATVATETTRQEESKDLNSAEDIRKIRSTANEDENVEKLTEGDTFSSQNVMDSGTVVTAGFTSSSVNGNFLKFSEDVNLKDKKPVKEPEDLSWLTGYDTVQMNLTQSLEASVWKDDSDTQNISYHDDNVSSKSSNVVVLEALSCYKDSLGQEVRVHQTNDVIETVGHVEIEGCNTEAEGSMDVQGRGQGQVGEKCEDPTNEADAAQEINSSHQLVSAAQEPAVDVSGESGISTAMDACNNSQQENTHSDHSENLQVNSKQKKRKIGSSRRTQLNRKEGKTDDKDETTESDFNAEADVRKMEVVEELLSAAEVSLNKNAPPLLGIIYKEQQETDETSSVRDNGLKLQSSTSDLTTVSNVIPGKDDLMVHFSEQSASHNEEGVDPVTFVKLADIRDPERNVDVSVEPSQLDDFTSAEVQITSGGNRRSINQLLPPDTESANTDITGGSLVSFSETTQSTQEDEETPESVKVTQDQDTDEQRPNSVNEGAHNKNLEMKNASPNFNSTNRRRKMASTRKNLGSRTKGEDLPQKQEVDDEATESETTVGGVMTESVPGIEEKELQLHKDRKEKVFETVEYSHVGESQLKPLAQQSLEEDPVSQGQLVETEHQLTPNYLPSTSPKSDIMSESASRGRRRKMGSHRKSRGHHSHEDQTAGEDRIIDAQNGRDVTGIPEEGAIKATEEHREESAGLEKISEVDESDKKPSSNINISKVGEHSWPVGEKTPVQPAEIRLGQEGQKQFSLAGNPQGADLRSNGHNVVMIGDSSVGKTSFLKRARSGKFSLDLPASIGLDSCVWTVVVDGKPVVLHLWDTAGQERFRSITRQIFHRAQAFLLMYDITSSQSFSAVSYWANCIQEAAAENVTVLLLGNKSDRAERQVKTQQGEILAKEYNFAFMECSAATGENVIHCLETVARMLSHRTDSREEATVLHKEPEQKKGSRCC